MDLAEHNRQAWNKESSEGGEWSIPVSSEQIEQARNDQWSIILTPLKSVPREWFGELQNKSLLGLASGGGQQMPILAAAGAKVTSFDNSDEQLAKDQKLAEQHQLDIQLQQGDMRDLSVFADESFDIIFHPISNCFIDHVEKVWQESYRVLKPGGRLLAGFCNPALYLIDHDEAEQSQELKIVNSLPFNNVDEIKAKREANPNCDEAIEFSHTLESQIGGQIAAGFVIHGFYEDHWNDEATPLNKYTATSIATLAIKPEK